MINKYEKIDIKNVCKVFNGRYTGLSTKEYSEKCEIPSFPMDKSNIEIVRIETKKGAETYLDVDTKLADDFTETTSVRLE